MLDEKLEFYTVMLMWPDGSTEGRDFRTTRDLRIYLNSHVFCGSYECRLPAHVSIERKSRP